MRQLFFVLSLLGGLVAVLPGCGSGPKDHVPSTKELQQPPGYGPITPSHDQQPDANKQPGDQKKATSAAQ